MSRPTGDKVTVSGNYDTSGRCISIFIYLNDSVITAEDIAFAVRYVFRPDAGITVTAPTKWTAPPVGSVSGRASAADTVTDLRIEETSTGRKWF